MSLTGTLDDSPLGDTKAAERRGPFDHIHAVNQFLINFAGGDHFIFSGRWSDQSGGEQDSIFQEYIRASSTAFWDAFLKEDKAALQWLSEDFANVLGENGNFERK